MTDIVNSSPLAYRVNTFLKLIGIGRTKFYEMIKSGEIRTVLIGGRRLIPHSEALRLVGDPVQKAI